MARPGRITFGEWRELGGASDSYERKRAARRRVLSLSGGAPAERAPPARGAVDASTSRAVHLADFVTTREPRPHARPDERRVKVHLAQCAAPGVSRPQNGPGERRAGDKRARTTVQTNAVRRAEASAREKQNPRDVEATRGFL